MPKAKISRKRQQEIMADHIKAWNNGDTELWRVYGRYSYNKERAFERCWNLCCRLDGEKFAIISHNGFIFTVGFYFTDEETGVLKFFYITPTYDYIWDA